MTNEMFLAKSRNNMDKMVLIKRLRKRERERERVEGEEEHEEGRGERGEGADLHVVENEEEGLN